MGVPGRSAQWPTARWRRPRGRLPYRSV